MHEENAFLLFHLGDPQLCKNTCWSAGERQTRLLSLCHVSDTLHPSSGRRRGTSLRLDFNKHGKTFTFNMSPSGNCRVRAVLSVIKMLQYLNIFGSLYKTGTICVSHIHTIYVKNGFRTNSRCQLSLYVNVYMFFFFFYNFWPSVF